MWCDVDNWEIVRVIKVALLNNHFYNNYYNGHRIKRIDRKEHFSSYANEIFNKNLLRQTK